MYAPAPRPNALVTALLAPALLLGLLALGAPQAAAKEWDSEQHNVLLAIPDRPAPWDWLPFNGQWPKLGIVKGAQRTVDKLKRTGEPADGHGAMMHLAVWDAEEGRSLAEAADSKKVREFLLARFQGTEEDVQVEETTVDSASNREGHPAIVIRATGKAPNLKARKAAATGYMLVTQAKGKLYLLRMYAFPAEHDDEGLVYDLDYLEGNSMRLFDTKEESSAKPPPPEDGPEPAGGDGPAEEERKDEVVEHRVQEWRITIDKKIDREDISDQEKADHLVIKCRGSDRMGGYTFYVYAPPTSQVIDGVQAPPPNLMKWIGPDWWQNFTVNHPKGELATFRWPRRPSDKRARTFMTLPDLDDEDDRHVVFRDGQKRPIEMSFSDMRKAGFVEKVKRNRIGRRGKVSEAVRGIMQGKRERLPGHETILRYAFRDGGTGFSYRVFVSFWGEAYKKWGEALRRTLESWEFGVEFDD